MPALGVILSRLGTAIEAVQKVGKAKASIQQITAGDLQRLLSGDKDESPSPNKPKGKKALGFTPLFKN